MVHFTLVYVMQFSATNIFLTIMYMTQNDTSYGSWIYNYVCNQCLSPLKLYNKTDRHNITEILLKVALNTISLTQMSDCCLMPN